MDPNTTETSLLLKSIILVKEKKSITQQKLFQTQT